MADSSEKPEGSEKKLAKDVAELREEARAAREERRAAREEQRVAMKALTATVLDIQRTPSALANATTAALKQLGLDKSIEIRVQRPEDPVFGPKH